jgi:putative holliday junction resolvase
MSHTSVQHSICILLNLKLILFIDHNIKCQNKNKTIHCSAIHFRPDRNTTYTVASPHVLELRADSLVSHFMLINTSQLDSAFPADHPLLGLDLGTKTIGLAISDRDQRIASPLFTIQRTKFTADVAELIKVISTHHVVGLVIGMPLNMDGSEGPRAQSTRAFVRNLTPKVDLPMMLWDERLSTAAVTRTLLEADASRARRQQVVDKMAAAYILQGVLDRLFRMREQEV